MTVRHDFDLLPRSSEIGVRTAQHSELFAIAEMGNRMVPGVHITEPDLDRYFAFDPSSIVTFSRRGQLLGAVAFIFLNGEGLDALLHARMQLTQPDLGLLADRSEQVAAIYVWAIAGRGKAMAGLGNVSGHLCQARLADADLYAQPSSEDGRNLMVAIGFEPIVSSQRELWRYQRPWNRAGAQAAKFAIDSGTRAGPSTGSLTDARH